MTVIMAVNAAGLVHYEILNHNCRKVDFIAFMSHPNMLKKRTFVMDNIRFHHSKEIKAIAQANGITILYSPPYSPKMNTIEMVFGMLKPMYRKSCPLVFTKQFDYVGTFRHIVDCERTFEAFFEHTKHMISKTLEAIVNDPIGFEFCGYDT